MIFANENGIMSTNVKAIVSDIAKRYLRIDSLAPRNMDDLDFHERHVLEIQAALEAAFAAGVASTKET